ncbi:hypothetical protein [Elioraea sp.]|uniref:phage tail fiber protein n=1 Tax=Elioraea sp. TaxID=2185103 RepID=UPI0025C054FF|nr:hypothetical protein [Elioraea sp.]
MASNLTTAGATFAMAALAGTYWLGLGTGQNPAGLVGEASTSGTGYARVPVIVTPSGPVGTNDSAATFTGFTVTQGAFTHGGLFTAQTGGECRWVGSLNAAVNIQAGVPITIQPGDLDVEVEVTA